MCWRNDVVWDVERTWAYSVASLDWRWRLMIVYSLQDVALEHVLIVSSHSSLRVFLKNGVPWDEPSEKWSAWCFDEFLTVPLTRLIDTLPYLTILYLLTFFGYSPTFLNLLTISCFCIVSAKQELSAVPPRQFPDLSRPTGWVFSKLVFNSCSGALDGGRLWTRHQTTWCRRLVSEKAGSVLSSARWRFRREFGVMDCTCPRKKRNVCWKIKRHGYHR